jgi:hypothetical protein
MYPPCMFSPCDREKEKTSCIVASAKKELIVAKIPQTAVENSPVPLSPLTVPRIATRQITRFAFYPSPCASCQCDARAVERPQNGSVQPANRHMAHAVGPRNIRLRPAGSKPLECLQAEYEPEAQLAL